MLTDAQKVAVRRIARAAVDSEAMTGCPAELSAAQAIFESGYLTKAPGNNCFGIKLHPGVSGWQLIPTHEWFTNAEVKDFLAKDSRRTAELVQPVLASAGVKYYAVKDVFAYYPTLEDCFADHARILQSGGYLPAWQAYVKTKDLADYITGIAPHYATDADYAAKITAESRSATVLDALSEAREA